jgi:hypothetical protein
MKKAPNKNRNVWQDPAKLTGHQLLEALVVYLRRFVVLTVAQAVAIALWVLHSHAFQAADTTPYVILASPEMECGKSLLMEVVMPVSNNGWYDRKPSLASLVRKIDKEDPTLFLDEVDAIFKNRGEYSESARSILNCGNRRMGSRTTICVKRGDEFVYESFSAFCPKMLAGIGEMPGTVVGRSIVIRMKRRKRTEVIERFRYKKVMPYAQALNSALHALAASLPLEDAEPSMPSELGDRAADGWEPLLAIADAIGHGWPERARAAALELSCDIHNDDRSLGIKLLEDTKYVFGDKRVDKLSSEAFVSALNLMEESPWPEYRGKPLTPTRMASLLKPFEIEPKNIRIGTGQNAPVRKGYEKAQFVDAWSRYLPAGTGSTTATGATPAAAQSQLQSATADQSGSMAADAAQDQTSLDVADGTVASQEIEEGTEDPDQGIAARDLE